MSIYESTRFLTYGTICRICTFGNQQQKNPALKIFHCLQFSNFVNLRIYAVFHLWYNIQDMLICKSTTQQEKKYSFKNFQCLPFTNFVNLRIYAVFHLWYNIQDLLILKSTNQQQKNPALKIFRCLQFSNFVNLRTTWFFTYGTICRIYTFGNQQQKKIQL